MPETPAAPRTVEEVMAELDPASAQDARTLMDLMHRISGADPEIWNVATIGYGRYHYRYDSGREGDGHALGFYPRTGKLTIYLMDGTSRHAEELARLGRHTTSRVCIYAKRVADLDLAVLESVLRDSYAYLKEHDGDMHRA
jgi:hypothetical protein